MSQYYSLLHASLTVTMQDWKKAERNRLKAAVEHNGFGRWAGLRIEAKLERHSPNAIKAYAHALLRKVCERSGKWFASFKCSDTCGLGRRSDGDGVRAATCRSGVA